MAASRPVWLADLSRAFKRHRQGRPGWFLELHRDRLRLRSHELPARPGEAPGAGLRRTLTLTTPPGPSEAARALAEACVVFDAVLAGSWRWPSDPESPPPGEIGGLPSPVRVQQLAQRLRQELVGERMIASTWARTWEPYLAALQCCAGQGWAEETAFLQGYLKGWPAGSRARQMAHDRARRLWKVAGWPWPEAILKMRGSGKAAADPEGVRAFTDAEIATLRERIQGSSKLTERDLVGWDCLVCFGLRPAELQVLQLCQGDNGTVVANVTRAKWSSRGSSGIRKVPAVPPSDWPRDCHGLLQRWEEHGLPAHILAARSPGQILSRQLQRLHMPEDLSSYGLRHAFALRLGLDLGLHVREATELMGHTQRFT